MVLEDTYLYSTGDWTVFRKTFGLARPYPYGSLSQVSPQGAVACANPGFQGSPSDPGYGDDGEAILDVEWASAAAPNAAIVLAACADTTTTFGGLIALENVLNGPAGSLPSVVSISYGESEEYNGAAANLAYNNAYQQAVAEGVSIFVSSATRALPAPISEMWQLTELQLADLLPHLTTFQWADSISAIRRTTFLPAPTGVRPIATLTVRHCRTFRRFRGTTHAPADWSLPSSVSLRCNFARIPLSPPRAHRSISC